jgi:hypothetical protein
VVVSEANMAYQVRVCVLCRRLMRRRELAAHNARHRHRPGPVASEYSKLAEIRARLDRERLVSDDLCSLYGGGGGGDA